MGLKTVRCSDDPVRMCSVAVTVLVYHLKLYPETEFQSHLLYLTGKSGNSVWKLVLIYKPVAKALVIIVSCSEPSVIQNEQLYPNLFGFFCNIEDFFLIKIKIGCFPVIKKDRTCMVSPFTAHQAVTVQSVVSLAHSV